MPIVLRALAVALLAGALLQSYAGEPAPADSTENSRRLIQALGADTYTERDKASRELFAMGRAAIEPLEFAAKSDDPEIRIQATRLLLSLRGRGFMGINLQEEQPGAGGNPYFESDDPAASTQEFAAPVVRVVRIAKPEDIPNNRSTDAKPFPAEVAGMQAGDKVLAINGRPLHGVKDLMREVIVLGPAKVAQALIERDGKIIRLSLILTRNPGDYPPKVDLEREGSADVSSPHAPRNILEQPARVVLKQQAKPDDGSPNPDPAGKKDLKAQPDDAKK